MGNKANQNETGGADKLALGLSSLGDCFFFFYRQFFCSHGFNIPEDLRRATVALLGMGAHHNTFWIPSTSRMIRRGIQKQRRGLSLISAHGIVTLKLDGCIGPRTFRVGRNLDPNKQDKRRVSLRKRPKHLNYTNLFKVER